MDLRLFIWTQVDFVEGRIQKPDMEPLTETDLALVALALPLLGSLKAVLLLDQGPNGQRLLTETINASQRMLRLEKSSVEANIALVAKPYLDLAKQMIKSYGSRVGSEPLNIFWNSIRDDEEHRQKTLELVDDFMAQACHILETNHRQ